MPSKLTKKFLKFHRENPHVYKRFVDVALRATLTHNHFGGKAVFERMRWDTDIVSSITTQKLCNNFHPFYCRLFTMEYPQHRKFFRHKKSVADELYDLYEYEETPHKNQDAQLDLFRD